MRHKLAIFIAAALGGTLVTGIAAAQKSPTQIDIAAMPPGAAPPGFTFWRTGNGAAAEWQVVADPSAGAKKAIAQTSKDTTDYRFPLAVFQQISAKDVDVVARFKPVAGTVDQAGGIAVRLTTPDDYYVVRANALEDNVRFYRVIKGRREQIAGANVKVTSGSWHSLGLRAQGNHFAITFDGKQLFTADDATFAEGDKVALWTKADSVTLFDWLEVTVLPKPASFLHR